ncbi:hypothetical protein NAF17_07070 [Mucilaginibacter sp. RB4R14]|uniref:DNA-formamidopyrimidine glycosylase family protein n=1 Tax=Mucilaginibacter aurantiaciroseus TaxID=2949308 RepID=UPI0020917741|nr:DNA-formamidopyrimidine glycosylase family protein [Mucilaginibacter aurantiaciroseus]MCO5935296.1 hypothetical protein [Mucilaginibacter aurantiaciroseus]
MAELPDLTFFSRILNRKYSDKKSGSWKSQCRKKINVSEAALKSALKGQELIRVRREGKTLQLDFSGYQVLIRCYKKKLTT